MKKKLCCVLAALVLTGCSANLVNLEYKEGQLINKRLKLAYNAAPTNYEPVSVGNPYGYYKDMDMTLYEIAGLDPKVTKEMYELIANLNRRDGITVIMVSHDIVAATQYASHILHIRSDHHFFGTAEEYSNSRELRQFTNPSKGGDT